MRDEKKHRAWKKMDRQRKYAQGKCRCGKQLSSRRFKQCLKCRVKVALRMKRLRMKKKNEVQTKMAKCVCCNETVPLQTNGELEPHMDIYPTRWCEGGNRKPGDMGRRPGVK